ncbi:hypothetical protein [Salana multivorans]
MSDQSDLAPGEADQLGQTLELRFAPHLEAATTAVREAEQRLATAQQELERAVEAAESTPYRSDPRVFMRDSVAEEVDALSRKTAPKKARASYRFLLDRAVELAAAEVQGHHDDETTAEHEREHGVDALRDAVARAQATLEAAHETEARVRGARDQARAGLALLVETLTAAPQG